MRTIETLMDGGPKVEGTVTLREPRPGDFGTIVARHAILYAQEYGWTENFEGLCAQIVADFVNNFDPKRERCWIAEVDGQYAGSVMLVKDTDEGVARLRLLLVEPSARGLGIGADADRGMRGFAQCMRLSKDHAVDPSACSPRRGISTKAAASN